MRSDVQIIGDYSLRYARKMTWKTTATKTCEDVLLGGVVARRLGWRVEGDVGGKEWEGETTKEIKPRYVWSGPGHVKKHQGAFRVALARQKTHVRLEWPWRENHVKVRLA